MATKDWKKVGRDKNMDIQFQNNKISKSLGIDDETKLGGSFYLSIWSWKNGKRTILDKNFKTKSHALAYARRYMRTN